MGGISSAACELAVANSEEKYMKALVYHGGGKKQWETMADPSVLRDTDAIIRVDSSTICGTDLHILEGGVPWIAPGRILGHEGTGTVVDVGRGTSSLAVGDRVLCKCVASCGKCLYCRRGQFGQCIDEEGGWMLGGKADGVQAEYARIAHADNSLIKVPQDLSNEQVIYLSDIMVTGFEVGVLRANVQPGETVVVVGAGPVGLSTMAVARLYSPAMIIAVELSPARRDVAKSFADIVVTPEEALAAVQSATDGLGADVAIEAVGRAKTFEHCCELVRVGGRVANIGLHSHPATLHLETLWLKEITITTGIPNHRTAHILLKAIKSGILDPTKLTSHRYQSLHDMMKAYDVFERPAETNAMKILLGDGAAHGH
jgi:alcohol dehydrogenase